MFTFFRPILSCFSRALLCAGLALAVAAPMAALGEDEKAEGAELCALLALMENYELAFSVCKLAAEQGDTLSQGTLGLMFYYGRGVEQDKREAAKWYQMAAEQGVAEVQFDLGNMYHKGDGVSQDMREAAKWYKLAAEQGVAEAQYNIGQMHYNGEGVALNKSEAAKWFQMAAEQGVVSAQGNLGVMYAIGDGVAQDYYEAYIWFSLATVGGHEKAGRGKELAENQLTASEIRSANAEIKKRLAAIEARQK